MKILPETFFAGLDAGTVIFLIVMGFISCFIDSTVGGGGLIITPALLYLGLSVPIVLGTSKLAFSIGCLVGAISFWRAGKIKKEAFYLLPFSVIGALAGTGVVYLLPEKILKNIVVLLLVLVAAYTYRRKDWGDTARIRTLGLHAFLGAVVMALLLGFYDGFFGPGTGTFLIFAFLYLGYDFSTAAGNGRLLNFASNTGGLVSFILNGDVLYNYGLILAVAMIAGAVFGTRVAIKKGAAYIRPLFLIITTLLIGSQVYEILFK